MTIVKRLLASETVEVGNGADTGIRSSGPGTYRRRPWRQSLSVEVTIAAMTLSLLGIAILSAFMYWAVLRVDAEAADNEKILISRAIDEQIAAVRRDQQKVTVGDDPFYLTKFHDHAWMAENVGAWMYASYGHEQGYVLDDSNRAIYAMKAGETVDIDAFDQIAPRTASLVGRVREYLEDDPEVGDLGVGDIMAIDGKPSIVTAKPIVPSTDRALLAGGSEYLHVAVKHVDSEFFAALGERYLVDNVRFRPREDTESGQNAVPLLGAQPWALGYVVWDRQRPGLQLIREAAPGLGTAVLVVGFLVGFLLVRIRRAAMQVHASESRFEHLATHDDLTGMPNRALLYQALECLLAGVAENGGAFALHYVDLDRFKNVNDTFGHAAGDALIRSVANRLATVVGDDDMVVRLGGDEFAIVQANVTGRQDAENLAGRMMSVLARPFDIMGNQIFIGASMGISIAPQLATDRPELLRKADIALYEAKAAGKGQFCVFRTELDNALRERQAIERDLREALHGDTGLRVVYQPIYAIDGTTILGAEALVRWDHPVRGAMSPAAFVAIAEERGLIGELGEWVLREACSMAKKHDLPWIAVNASAVQFRDGTFAEKVLDILYDLRLEPTRLQLEITEGLLLDLSDEVRDALALLRGAGVRFALDDFGTGYSSLQYLHQYEMDKIKIDRSFVQRLGSSDSGDAIVRAMLDLAQAFDLVVTAEGIETAEQVRILKRFGCNELQGFLLSRPVDASVLGTLVASSNRRSPDFHRRFTGMRRAIAS